MDPNSKDPKLMSIRTPGSNTLPFYIYIDYYFHFATDNHY